jgi:hypothetical protein
MKKTSKSLSKKIIKKCEKCAQENETVYANYLLYGFMICESCKLSDTLFPVI